MKKLFQRLFIALAVAALPLYAIADYTATQGAGTTVFAFVCQSTKVCPAHVNINSSATEIFTGPSPGFVTLTNSNVTATVSGTVTVSSANTINVNALQATAASLNATVVGTGTFAVQAAQSGTWTVQPGNTANTTPWLITCSNCTTAGGATAANQATEIASLATIATNTGAAIPAGTNVIGALTGATSGGFTTLTMTNLLTTPNAIKASSGQLVKLYCYNPNASVAYVQVFNVASGSVTAGTTKPSQTYGIPATNAAGFSMSPVGDQYSTAMSAVATTTASGGTPPSSGVDCSVSFF